MSIRPLAALVRKDIRLYLSDRRAVILSFVAPILLASLFASMTRGRRDDEPPPRLDVAVVDEDGSELSRKVVAAIASDENFQAAELPLAEAREAVRKGRAVAAVVLPADFGIRAGRALFGGEPPEVVFLHDPTRAVELGYAQGLLARHLFTEVSRETFSGESAPRLIDEALAGLDSDREMSMADRLALGAMLRAVKAWTARQAEASRSRTETASTPFSGGLREPFTTRSEPILVGGGTTDAAMAAHAFAGMSVQFILFSSIEAGVALLTERQKGLWRRIRAAPVGRATLLLGRAISGALIALLILAAIYAFGAAFFGIRIRGSWAGFALVGLGYALTASSFGLLIAALGKTPQGARGVSILAVLLMVLLGGAWFPAFLFPDWLRTISYAVPTRWAIVGLEGATTRGMTLAEALTPAALLLGFAAAFGALAFARFRWDEG